MGESPEVVKIACPGCETQFRLKPKKGRLPKGPVPCPKCGESIPIVEENIRRDDAPQAHVFSRAGDETDKVKNRTVAGAPAKTPHRSDAIDRDEEFDHIAVAPGLSESNPKSTFLGMGSALAAIERPGNEADKTAVVDQDVLAKIRSESSVVEDDEDEAAEADDAAASVFSRETSETKAVSAADLAKTTEKIEDAASSPEPKDDAAAEQKQAPGQMVLGKIKIKKKLKRAVRKQRSEDDGSGHGRLAAGERAPSKPGTSDDTTKPSLSSLLQKARENKGKLGVPRPPRPASEASSADKSAEDLDRALDDLADETARSFAEKPADKKPPAFDSGDSSMIDLLRRRVAENQQPGAASERRGSGYIRLPTAEIQDVLGQGTYRLRVEDIVYEPIDKEGLTQLVKRGVLLGAEEIAEPDGDWMPIADHPVFLELRRKMAREAHDLLKQYGKPAQTEEAELPAPHAELPAPQADLPAPQADLPGRVDELPTLAADGGQRLEGITGFEKFDDVDDDDIPMLEAELEEEAEQAARELFADDDAPEETGSGIELDYDALGVEEDEVSVEHDAPRPADETGAMAKNATSTNTTSKNATSRNKRGSMRTWIPLVAAAAVLGVIGLALSPVGRPVVDDLLGQETTGETPADQATASAAGEAAEDEAANANEAVSEASSTLAAALEVDAEDAGLQESVAGELVEDGRFEAASRVMSVLWPERRDDADFAASYVEALIEAGRFAEAREVAIDGGQLDASEHDFAALFVKALEEDQALRGFDAVEVTDEMADAAKADTDGDRLVLRLSTDGQPAYRFEPAQSGWERGWRASIASYRLCQIMVCNFDIPQTRPAKIDRATFEKLAGDADASGLVWESDDGKEYVYGALQDAVGEPARFPVEMTELWRGFLNVGSGDDLQKTQAADALASLRGHAQGFYEPLANKLGEATLAQVGAELSSVLVFDFLTNNWARFQDGEEKWGTHLHAADGGLVSISNGDAFQPRASTRIKGRFSWMSRFSEDTIASLRLIEPELVDERLYPDASAGERARLEVFWSQRDEVLERVDELSRAHGAKEALAFE